MSLYLKLFFVLLVFIIVISIAWRWACSRWVLPWPHWLSFMMENPYMLVVNNPLDVVKRLDIQPGHHVLEVGCGAGRILVHCVKAVGEKGSVTGVDVQPLMLKKAKRRLDRQALAADLKCLDVTKLSGDFGRFDQVILVTVLGEIPRYNRFLEVARDWLAPGGVLSITEVIPDPCYLTKSSVRLACEGLGFDLISEHSRLLDYTLNFRKS